MANKETNKKRSSATSAEVVGGKVVEPVTVASSASKPNYASYVQGDKALKPTDVAKLSDEHLFGESHGNYKKAVGYFKKAAEEGHYKLPEGTTNFEAQSKALKKIEETIAVAKSGNQGSEVIADLEKELEATKTLLSEKGVGALKYVEEGLGHSKVAIEALQKIEATHLEELGKEFKAKRDAITLALKDNPEELKKALAGLNANEKTVGDAFKAQIAEKIKPLTETETAIKATAKHIETHTGAKVSEHAPSLKSGLLSGLKDKGAGMMEKLNARGWGGKTICTLGGIGVLHGLYSAINPETDKETGERKGSLVFDLGEAAVGAGAVFMTAIRDLKPEQITKAASAVRI